MSTHVDADNAERKYPRSWEEITQDINELDNNLHDELQSRAVRLFMQLTLYMCMVIVVVVMLLE